MKSLRKKALKIDIYYRLKQQTPMININPSIPIVGIYKIISPSGKIYIGQSTDIDRRKKEYERLQCKSQSKLYNSLKKHSWESHIHEIIEKCPSEQLNEREIYWGEYHNVLGENGLNLKLGNTNGKMSDESKQKMKKPKPGAGGKGKPKPKNFKGNKGNKFSKSTLEKLSAASKGRQAVKGKTWNWKSTKSILQCDKQGNIIKEYNSYTLAKKHTNINGINNVLTGRAKTAGGFIWKVKN